MASKKQRWPKGTYMRLISPETLRALMDQKGYSYERLGRYAGCSPSFISHLIKARKNSCSSQLAENLAEALDVPLSVLFAPGDSTDGRSVPKFRGRAA